MLRTSDVSFCTLMLLTSGLACIPLAFDSLVNASLNPAFGGSFVNFTGTIGANETATVLINVPAGFSGMGLAAYGAWIGYLPQPPGGLAISDNILLPIQ